MRFFSRRVLRRPATEVAPLLLGARLRRHVRGGDLAAVVVETEAYDEDDPAAHSYRGRTPRNEVMFDTAGRLYVYFTYGMHFCMNVVAGRAGRGEAVLIRALEPVRGLRRMADNRGVHLPAGSDRALRKAAEHDRRVRKSLWALAGGPARLTEALEVDRALDGIDLLDENSPLTLHPPVRRAQRPEIEITPRVGIRKATEKPWRFYLRDSSFISKR